MKKPVKRRKNIERPFADGTVSNAAFFGMIRAALRNKSRWWKPISTCRDNAKIPYVGPNKRRKWMYKCESCGGIYDIKGVNVHHKIDCGSLNSFEDLPGFVKRLFCDSKDLILICNKCHDKEHKK